VHKPFAVLLILLMAVCLTAAPADDALRSEAEAATDALLRNDRPAFDEHYARVKANPRAADSSTARVLDDAALVWNALFQSPFFAEGSEVYARVSAYPGYANAVRRGILTVGGQRLYPAADSLHFLAGLAAQRLGRSEAAAALPRVARARRTKG